MTSTNNGVELLISLNIDNQKSRQNVDSYINSLKKQLEQLDVTLMVKGDYSNDKMFKQMEQQITTLQNQVKELNKQLSGIGSGGGASKPNISIAIGKDLKEAQDMISDFLKGAGHRDFDIKINADVTEGERILKNFVASVKDADGEIRKLTFMPDGKGSFQEIKETLNDNTITQYNKVLKSIDDTILSVERSGLLGAEALRNFNEKIGMINSSDITLDKKISRLRTELSLLNNEFDEEKHANKMEESMKKAQRAIQDLESSFRKTVNTYKRETKSMDLSKWENEISSLKQVPIFTNQKDIDTFFDKINKAKSNVRDFNAQVTESMRGSLTIFDQFKIAMERFPIWMAASTAFFGTVRTAKEFMSIIVDIDTKLTNISKVISDDMDISEVFDRATQSAETFGQSISDALDAYTEFARQGFKGEDLGFLSDAGLVAANVGELSAQKASEYMTASMLQWNIEAKNSMSIIDAWNSISNRYATTVEKLASGNAVAASTAKTMGLEFDQLNAIIGTVTAATKQSGNEVGRFVKNALPRLISQPAQDAMKMLDVSLTDDKGNIRDVIEVYTEIANKMQDLTEVEQISVKEGLAGKDHISRMSVLLDDLASADSMYRSMYETSTTSAGSAMVENEKYMDSLQARINLARVEVEKLAISIGDAFLTEGAIQSIKVFSDFLGVLTKVTNSIGALPILLGTLGFAVVALSKNYRNLTISMGLSAWSAVRGEISLTTLATKAQSSAVGVLSKSWKGFLASSGVGIGLLLIGVGLEKFISKLGETREVQEQIRQDNKALADSYNSNRDSIKSLSNEYADLEKAMDSSKPDAETQNRYYEVQNQLAKLMPSLVKFEDSYGNSILISSSAVESKTNMLEAQILAEEKLAEVQKAREEREKIEASKDIIKDGKRDAENFLNTFNNQANNSFGSGRYDYGEQINNLQDMENAIKEFENRRVKALQEGNEGIAKKLEEQISNMRDSMYMYIQFTSEVDSAQSFLTQTTAKNAEEYISESTKMSDSTKKLASDMMNSFILMANSSEEADIIASLFDDGVLDSSLEEASDKIQNFTDSTSKSFETQKEALETYGETLKSNILNNLRDADGKLLNSESKAYQNLEKSINSYISKVILQEEKIRKKMDTERLSRDEVIQNMKANGELDDSVAIINESLEKQIEKLKELSSVQEQIVGVSDAQVDAVNDSIFAIETLGNVTEISAQQQSALANNIELLSSLYPHLTKLLKGTTEERKKAIAIIQQENEANRILLESYKLASNGQYTEEQKRTLYSAQGTKARIDNIIAEIKALILLQDQIENTAMTSQEFIDGINKGSVQSVGSSFYIPTLVDDKISSKTVELEALQSSLQSVTGTLSGYNTAINEASKSSSKSSKSDKDANKSTEKSIYITDKYKQALEELNYQIERQAKLREGLPEYSDSYRKSLEAQIKLEKDKLNLQQKQANELDKQIKSGKILQTGNVSTKTSSSSSTSAKLNGWNGAITSGYGNRILDGKKEFHRGIDIDGYTGQRIDAGTGGKVVASGKASSQGYHSSYGNIVVVQDESGQKHLYAHLEKAIAKLGSTISAGTQIGTIGSTGNSTGSHLHYEINVNGKPIDPSQYIADAKKGIVSATTSTLSAVSNTQQSIDEAKSQLTQLLGEMEVTKENISNLEIEEISSYLADFNRRRDTYSQLLAYEDERMKSLDTTSHRYGATIEQNARFMERQQKVNQEELAYLNGLINSGTLSSKTMDEMRNRAEALKTEMYALDNAIQQLSVDKINAEMGRFDEYIDDLQYARERSEAIFRLMVEGSSEYNDEIGYRIKLMKAEQQAILDKRNRLAEMIRTEDLSIEQVKEKKEELEELSLAYHSLSGSIQDVTSQLADSLIEAYKNVISERKDMHMDSLDDEMEREQEAHDKKMKNLEDEMDLFRKNVQERLNLIDQEESKRSYDMEMDELETERRKIVDNINLLSLDTSNEGKSKLKKLLEDRDKIDKDIAEKRHDRDIELQKESLNNLLETKEEEIDGLTEAEDLRFETDKKRIDDLKEYWNQFYDDQLNDERKFAKIKQDIVAGNFDALSSEFQGFLTEMQTSMPSLENTLGGTMTAVGTSIRQNIIDNLQQALDMMSELKSGGSGSPSAPSMPQQQTISQADMKVILGKFMASDLASKTNIASRKEAVTKTGWSLANEGRSQGSTINSTESLDSILGTLSDQDKAVLSSYVGSQAGKVVSNEVLQNYIRKFSKEIASMSTGGMIPRSTGGIDGQGGKFAILHPNEIVNNPLDTQNLLQTSSIMDRIARLISPITNKGLLSPSIVGGGDINIQFGDVYGATPQQADTFAQRIVSGIKRKGGKI